VGVPICIDSSSYATTTTATSHVVNYPAKSVSGDLLILFIGMQKASGSSYSFSAVPTGWNLLDTEDQTTAKGMLTGLYWRFRGAETSVTFNLSASVAGTAQILAYQGDIDQTTPIDTSILTYDSTATSSAARVFPTVTTTSNNCKLAMFYNEEKTLTATMTWSSPVNKLIDGWIGTANLMYGAGTSMQRTAGTTPAYTITASGQTNETIMAVVAVKPGNTDSRPIFVDSLQDPGIAGSNTSRTYNYPSLSVSGDLMILIATAQGTNGTAAQTTPSGWTLLGTTNSFVANGAASWVYWRFRSSETSVTHVVSNTGGTIYQWGQLFCVDGTSVDPTSPIAASNVAINMTGGTSVSIPSVTTSVSNIVIHGGTYNGNGAVRTVVWDSSVAETGDICPLFTIYRGTTDAVNPDPANTTATSNSATISNSLATKHQFWTLAIQPPQSATVNGTDTAAGSDTASVIATTSTATDSGTGTEAASIKTTATADTGLGTEAASVIAVTPGTDSGTATDTAVANAVVFATDSATAVDVAFVKNTVLVSDSATAVDTAQITTQGSDTGSSVDTATGIGLDSGTGVDTASVIINGAVDTAFASESAFVSNTTLPTPDTATAVEQPATVAVKVTDTGTAAESVSTTANVPATDSAIATESAKVIIQGAVDSGNAVESAKIVQSVSDSATAVDIATIIVTVFGVDTGVALDIAAVMVSGSDGGTAVDTAFKFVSGQILSARVTRIAKDLRITLIEREPRTIQIEAQARKTIIGFEDRRVIKVPSESREFSISAEA
jgi:hypothetical protein